MAGFVQIAKDNVFPSVVVAASNSLKIGSMVDVTYNTTNKRLEAALSAATPSTVAPAQFFVPEDPREVGGLTIDSVDIAFAGGDFGKYKTLMSGEFFCTTETTGTIALGDTCVAVSGKIKKKASEVVLQAYECRSEERRVGKEG